MNKQKLLTSGIFAIFAISIGVAASSWSLYDEGYVYVESDITKANPNIEVAPTAATWATEEIRETKNTVILTFSGTVLSVGDPVDWTDESDTLLGFVPVTIEIDKKTKDKTVKGKTADFELKKGDQFTVYLGGVYESGKYYMHGIEPQFEIGEKVLLHVGHTTTGPIFEDNGMYFVELGQHGKYKIVGDKAYNEKHKEGISLEITFDEAN